ncbi:MAG TPA: OmpA family protein [Flavisolibacter sp.]
MRRFFLLVHVALACSISKAQVSVALVAGPQFNSVTPAFSLNPDTNSVYSTAKHTGITFGFIANAAINKKQNLFFRTGMMYSAKGSQLSQQYDTSKVDLSDGKHLLQTTTNLKLNYIDIPVNLLFKAPMKGKTKFLLGAGVQGSLFYNGSTDWSTINAYKDDPTSPTKLEYSETINKDLPVGTPVNKYRTVYFSVNALTGFEFGKVFMTAGYSKGITNFFKSDVEGFKHNTLTVQLGISLGNNRPVKTPQVKDRDKDGIADEIDECPDEPGTALTKGCPDRDGDGIADKNDLCPDLAGTIQNKGCPILDRDSDGVPDAEDKCPDVAGMKKYQGCPVPDTDKDGVNDEEDQCPEVAGDKDNHGCPRVTKEQQQKIDYAAKRIQFEFKKAELVANSYPVLDEVVEVLKSNPTFNIRVEGHSSGPESESNRVLSEERAESVKAYFISKGIAAERIKAQGFGSSRHLSKDGDKKENAEDRRVELIVF